MSRLLPLILLVALQLTALAQKESPNSYLLSPNSEVKIKLFGDGRTTSQIDALLENPTSESMTVHIPAFLEFRPLNEKAQALTTTTPTQVELPPRSQRKVPLKTICSDVMSKPPPGEAGELCTLAPPPEYLPNLVSTGRKLSQEGAYEKIPMPPEKAEETVIQLAAWTLASENSDNPEDQVTKEKLVEQICTQLGKAPEDLTPTQKEQVDEGVDNIFESVDLTLKTSKKESSTSKSPEVRQPNTSQYEGHLPTSERQENGDLVVTLPDGTEITNMPGEEDDRGHFARVELEGEFKITVAHDGTIWYEWYAPEGLAGGPSWFSISRDGLYSLRRPYHERYRSPPTIREGHRLTGSRPPHYSSWTREEEDGRVIFRRWRGKGMTNQELLDEAIYEEDGSSSIRYRDGTLIEREGDRVTVSQPDGRTITIDRNGAVSVQEGPDEPVESFE